MDMQKIPPIHQKRIVTFVNYFIIDTVSFLNNFINSSENSLWKLEKRMRKLETTLKLLEVKLNFISESKEENTDVPSNSQENEVSNGVESAGEDNKSTDDLESIQVEKTVECQPENEIPPEIQKYIKMAKVGVPIAAVKLKMQTENLDPNLLNLD